MADKITPVDPSGSAFNNNVYVWTEDSFTALPTTEGATFQMKAGTKAQTLFVDARFTSVEFYSTQPETYVPMTATGTIKNLAGQSITFDNSNIQWTDVRNFLTSDGLSHWSAKATDATGKVFYVSSHGLHPGETYTMFAPKAITDAAPIISAAPAYIPDPNKGLPPEANADLSFRIDMASTPDSPAYFDLTHSKDPTVDKTDLSKVGSVGYKAYDGADVIIETAGQNVGGEEDIGATFRLREGFTNGLFTSYDKDNYISDGNARYNSWINDVDQIGSYSVKDTGKVIYKNEIYQSEKGIVLQDPHGKLINVTRISFGSFENKPGDYTKQILLTSAELQSGVQYQVLNVDGSPGFPNPNTTMLELSYQYNNFIKCFVTGSLIKTKDGSKPVEELVTGDLVWTKDDGYQPIRWIGKSEVTSERLAQNENLRPIRIGVNTLGENMPSADLLVSRQHRMVMQSKLAMKFHGVDTVLVAAKDLLDLDGVEVVQTNEPVEYFHILFDKHQIIEANGCASESFYPGPRAVNSIDKDVRDELVALFPELANPEALVFEPAAQIVDGGKARKLVRLHAEKGLALQN